MLHSVMAWRLLQQDPSNLRTEWSWSYFGKRQSSRWKCPREWGWLRRCSRAWRCQGSSAGVRDPWANTPSSTPLGLTQHSLAPGNCHWPISELVWHLLELPGCMRWLFPLDNDQIKILSSASIIWVHRLLRITKGFVTLLLTKTKH